MSRIPVTIITGFLGAGKTTLLNRLLAAPGYEDSAVIVNEFGEAGLDGALMERGDERAFAMSTGCLCCTVSGDVRLTLLRLLDEAERGIGPSFSRVVIETTGLADPLPVIQTFMTNDFMLGRFTLNGVVTLVDAVSGLDAIGAHKEAARQAAVADLLVVTKDDLAFGPDDQDAAAEFQRRLKALNQNAYIANATGVRAEDVFSLAAVDPSGKPPDVADWLRFGDGGQDHLHHHHDVNAHGETATAYCFSAAAPLSPSALWDGVAALQRSFGRDLLRIKGLVAIADRPDSPLILHVVGHISSPPRLMDGWPDGVDGTRIVMIVSGPGRAAAPGMLTQFAPELRPFADSETRSN